MVMKLCILLFAFLVVGISGSPRQRRQVAIDESTTSTSTTTTTPSPRYLACMRTCLTTQQYNPICGTDGVTYMNEAKLSCAVRCGNNVQRAFLGAC